MEWCYYNFLKVCELCIHLRNININKVILYPTFDELVIAVVMLVVQSRNKRLQSEHPCPTSYHHTVQNPTITSVGGSYD